MPRSCGTHLLLAHSMVMPTVISASCHTSLHMSRALDSKIWKHASKYFQSPIHWLQPLGTWTPSIINKQSQHISSIIMILKFLLIWVCIINISLVNTNCQVGKFLYYKNSSSVWMSWDLSDWPGYLRVPGKCLESGHTLESGPSDRIQTNMTGVTTDIIYRYFQVMTREIGRAHVWTPVT